MRTYEEAITHLGNLAYSRYLEGSVYPDGNIDFAQLEMVLFFYGKDTLQEVYDDVCDVVDELIAKYKVTPRTK